MEIMFGLCLISFVCFFLIQEIYRKQERILLDKMMQAHLDQVERLSLESLRLMKAASLAEHSSVVMSEKQQNVAMQQLTDAYTQELEKIKQDKKVKDEITTEDGRKFPLSKLELVTPDELFL